MGLECLFLVCIFHEKKIKNVIVSEWVQTGFFYVLLIIAFLYSKYFWPLRYIMHSKHTDIEINNVPGKYNSAMVVFLQPSKELYIR